MSQQEPPRQSALIFWLRILGAFALCFVIAGFIFSRIYHPEGRPAAPAVQEEQLPTS